ncbi:MAG: hypothetical protein KBB14_13710 [Thermoanaerobaculia bacterium]|nr:hypothetical protein [Thermoanaerobaculia bacterium]
MNAPALAPVFPHPAIRGTVSDRVAVAEAVLVAEARRLAEVLALDDVAGLLGGASNLAASESWEARR